MRLKVNTASSRITVIWIGLVAATLLSWLLGHHFGFSSQALSGASIIGIAVLKVRYVILDFMELRHAPLPVRIGIEFWVLIATIAMIAMYWHVPTLPDGPSTAAISIQQ